MSAHELIVKQAVRVQEMADVKAPFVVMNREVELLQDLINKLPRPPRLPPRKKKEKWKLI